MIADGCRGVGFYPFLVMGILIDYAVEQCKYRFIAAGLEQPMPIYRFIRLRYETYDFLCIVAMRSSGMYVGVLDKVGGARPLKQAPWLSLAQPLPFGYLIDLK